MCWMNLFPGFSKIVSFLFSVTSKEGWHCAPFFVFFYDIKLLLNLSLGLHASYHVGGVEACSSFLKIERKFLRKL